MQSYIAKALNQARKYKVFKSGKQILIDAYKSLDTAYQGPTSSTKPFKGTVNLMNQIEKTLKIEFFICWPAWRILDLGFDPRGDFCIKPDVQTKPAQFLHVNLKIMGKRNNELQSLK